MPENFNSDSIIIISFSFIFTHSVFLYIEKFLGYECLNAFHAFAKIVAKKRKKKWCEICREMVKRLYSTLVVLVLERMLPIVIGKKDY